MVIYTADSRARKRRRLGHARKRGKRRDGCGWETVRGMMEEWKRCNPDGTRIRMTHGIICVYVIREIRHGGGTVTLPAVSRSSWIGRVVSLVFKWTTVSRCTFDFSKLDFKIDWIHYLSTFSMIFERGINISVHVIMILNYLYHDKKKRNNRIYTYYIFNIKYEKRRKIERRHYTDTFEKKKNRRESISSEMYLKNHHRYLCLSLSFVRYIEMYYCFATWQLHSPPNFFPIRSVKLRDSTGKEQLNRARPPPSFEVGLDDSCISLSISVLFSFLRAVN